MFSSFRNSDLAYYLYTAFVLILGIGSLVFFYFMVTGFNIGVYDANTLVGSVYVGGLNESEAEAKVRDRVEQWFDDETIVYEIGYQGYYYEIDRDLFTFDISGSIDNITDGTRNPLIVELSPQAMANIDFELHNEPFMSGLQGIFHFDNVMEDVLNDAGDLQQFSRHQLNHYTIDDAQLVEVINDITIQVQSGTDIDTLLANIESVHEDLRVPLASHSIYSVFDLFPDTTASSELNTIGSGILDLIKPTHFDIYERHYNPQISDVHNNPYIGRNARVNRHPNLNYDFRFENPTYLDYELEFYRADGETLGLRLHGAPSLDRVEIENEKTVLHYNEAPDGATIIEPGQDGKVVFIYRNVYDIDDNRISRTLIVFEYYEPFDPIVEED